MSGQYLHNRGPVAKLADATESRRACGVKAAARVLKTLGSKSRAGSIPATPIIIGNTKKDFL